MKIATYRVYNIDWDTDGQKYYGFLPIDITFNCEENENISDFISNWLSNVIGVVNYGFDYEFLGYP